MHPYMRLYFAIHQLEGRLVAETLELVIPTCPDVQALKPIDATYRALKSFGMSMDATAHIDQRLTEKIDFKR